MRRLIALVIGAVVLVSSGVAFSDDGEGHRKGLSRQAERELIDAGVNKYLGRFAPAVSTDVGDGWTKHTYAPDFSEGPLCIAGTPYSVFTKAGNPKNLLIFMQGGGACWQDFYFCNILAEDQEPPPPPIGIWGDSFPPDSGMLPNPIADYSIVYMPYCDGSVFSGDNDVIDPSFPVGPIRFHRGLQNASAGIDMAKNRFPNARRILLAGSSAGGVGVAGFAPFLVRMAFGNQQQLSVFNDAGPVAINLLDVGSIQARAADWRFGQFYPASCTECDDVMGQGTAIIRWRLDNDSTIREAFYSTDGDATNRFFMRVPTQASYRSLIVSEHGKLNAAHPDRYKRYIRSGDASHTALQTPLYYLGTANGVPLFDWVEDFLRPGTRAYRERDNDGLGPKRNSWVDIVEDFVPLP